MLVRRYRGASKKNFVHVQKLIDHRSRSMAVENIGGGGGTTRLNVVFTYVECILSSTTSPSQPARVQIERHHDSTSKWISQKFSKLWTVTAGANSKRRTPKKNNDQKNRAPPDYTVYNRLPEDIYPFSNDKALTLPS